MRPASPVMAPTDWVLLLILSVLWGGSFFFVAVAVKGLPPVTIVALRVVIAAAALLLALRLRGQSLPLRAEVWSAFLVMGLLNSAVPQTLIVWGQTHIASGLASILNATTPLFTVLVAHWATDDDRLGPGRIAGVVMGFAGVVLMIGPQALHGLGADVLAQVAILGATLSYAFAAVYGRRFKRLGVPPLVTATGMLLGAAVWLVPTAAIAETPWTLALPSPAVVAAVAGLALVSTALAYVFYFRILSSAGASNLSLVTFLIPISAILLGALVLGETLALRHFAGMAAIGLGLAAIDGRPLHWLPGVRLRRRRAD